MSTNKFQWKNIFLAFLAICFGFGVAAWVVFAANKLLPPNSKELICDYGEKWVDEQCKEIDTSISTSTQTSTATK